MEYANHLPTSGFDNELKARNQMLEQKGQHPPGATKTGTTIVGCVFDGGVLIAADTRATAGRIVAQKTCEKLHYVAPNMYAAGAGTAADTQFVTHNLMCQLELLRYKTRSESRMDTARALCVDHLFRYGGNVGAYLIFACLDLNGPQIVNIDAAGSSNSLPFTTMGSGSLAAMSVFETQYRDGMNKAEAMEVAANAIQAGIVNDMGSGSNVDIVTITKEEGAQYHRGFRQFNAKLYATAQKYSFPKGTTPIKGSYELVNVEAMDIE